MAAGIEIGQFGGGVGALRSLARRLAVLRREVPQGDPTRRMIRIASALAGRPRLSWAHVAIRHVRTSDKVSLDQGHVTAPDASRRDVSGQQLDVIPQFSTQKTLLIELQPLTTSMS